MDIILFVIASAIIIACIYFILFKEPEGRHPLESVKHNSEITSMPILTKEIDPPVMESAPVEAAVIVSAEVQAETKEESVAPKQEKKMATKKPAPSKKPTPAKKPAKPKK